MAHWHDHNPWAGKLVYIPLKEATHADFEKRLLENYGPKLDAYILPSPSGDHSFGIRFGPDRADYLSPLLRPELTRALLEKYGPKPATDLINKPPHYTSHPSGVECLTITRHMCNNLGNVIKYVWRADLKGDSLENLLKAEFYLQDEIKRRQEIGQD